jgi:hypothetical protein
LLLAQPILHIVLFQALPPPELLLPRARRPLPFSPLRGTTGCSGPGYRRVRPSGVHNHPLLIRVVKTDANATQEPEEKNKRTHRWSIEEHDELPEIIVVVRYPLEADRVPLPRSRC